MRKLLVLSVAAGLLLCASPVFAQWSSQIQMTYNGNNNYDGGTWQGGGSLGTETVITGFYGGTINGVTVGGSASNPGMLCDDYTTNLQSPWNAYAINAATLLENWGSYGGGTKFGGALGENGYIQMALIVEAAFTGNAAITSLAGGVSATAADVSEALWCITGGPANCTTSGTYHISQAAYNLIQNALALVGSANLSSFANLWLYTPTPQNGSQEMWGNVPVPEGGTALGYLLLALVSCMGAMFFRRQLPV